jgi:hypothetical protein
MEQNLGLAGNKQDQDVSMEVHSQLSSNPDQTSKKRCEADTRCPMCLCFDEDCGHLFFKCKLVNELGKLLDLEELRQSLAGMDSALEATSEHELLFFCGVGGQPGIGQIRVVGWAR